MSITTMSGYAAFAKARIGSNGDEFGAAECIVGVSSSDVSTGRKEWTGDTSAGFDTGWVNVTWTVTTTGTSGSLQWAVSGCSPNSISHTGTQGGTIGSVTIRAAVDGGNRRASFRNVVVEFYENASDTQWAERRTLANSLAPVASTWEQSGPVDAEVAVPIEPDGVGYNKIRMTAEVRLACADEGLPSEDTIFTDAFVFTVA